ncbi:cytochrome P450 [Earliella scabrosa]|nr:cytochrome P450 [Earliella scabrosa]
MSWSTPTVLLAGACVLLTVYWLLERRITRSCVPLPPGPPRLPILGNLFDLPKGSPRVGYRELSRKYGNRAGQSSYYGNLLYLKALGRSILVVNDAQTAIDLLEKRSATYSSRVASPVIAMIDVEDSFGFMPYNDVWRHHRRMFTRHFNASAVSRYLPVQKEALHRVLRALLDDPKRHREHLHFVLGSLIIKAAYGLDSGDLNSKYIRVMEKGRAANGELLSHATILEYFPFWARAPLWLPGTGVKNQNLDVTDLSPSMAQSVIAEYAHDSGESAAAELTTAKNVASLCYEAGVDTQLVTVESFLLAMASHTEVQRKAQAELDNVVGPHRLPEMDDRDALPYVNAILKETMRWHTAVPLGVPHTSTADDEYHGYFIPKNTMVVVNAWYDRSILHDPDTYSEPDKFIPERFMKDGRLNTDVRDPASIAFGFGRRICPGQFLADGTVFLFMASILHTFDISPPLDESGKPVHVELRGRDGLTSKTDAVNGTFPGRFLEDCRCTFKVRSSSAEELIRRLG